MTALQAMIHAIGGARGLFASRLRSLENFNCLTRRSNAVLQGRLAKHGVDATSVLALKPVLKHLRKQKSLLACGCPEVLRRYLTYLYLKVQSRASSRAGDHHFRGKIDTLLLTFYQTPPFPRNH
jgi:hypothetical protein